MFGYLTRLSIRELLKCLLLAFVIAVVIAVLVYLWTGNATLAVLVFLIGWFLLALLCLLLGHRGKPDRDLLRCLLLAFLIAVVIAVLVYLWTGNATLAVLVFLIGWFLLALLCLLFGHPGKPDRGEAKTGKVPSRHVKDAPFPPVPRDDSPARQPNRRPQRIVPDGPIRGVVELSSGSALNDLASGNPGGAGLDFQVWTDDPTVAPASTNAADVSGAKGGSVVLLSGNWYIDYSTDSGATFTTLDPTTIFPDTLAGGFCCDQVLQYAPTIDRFLWLLQYSQDGTGANAYRLAAASPQDVIDSNCTAWTYWDLPSSIFGLGTDWMDYPSMSLGDGEAYISFDVLDSTGDTVADNGLVVVRFNLAEIAAGGTINFGYTNPADSAVAWGSGVSQDTGNEVFWAGHVDNSTLRVFSWRNDSGFYSWRDVEVANWPNATLSSNGPSPPGNNWFGWGFPNNAVIGITRRSNELWLGWTASSGDGGAGGFNFPHPHVQIVKLNIADWTVIEQMQVWNPDLAFGYPSLATNSDNEVGIALGWGGGGSLHANSAVGFMGDYVVWFRDGSTWTHTRWGDYVSIRRAAPETHMFAGFGYIITDTSTGAGHRYDPYYVLFGREPQKPIG